MDKYVSRLKLMLRTIRKPALLLVSLVVALVAAGIWAQLTPAQRLPVATKKTEKTANPYPFQTFRNARLSAKANTSVHAAYILAGNNDIYSLQASSVPKAEPSPASAKDLTLNGIPESYTLAKGRLTVQELDKTIWQSPENWWVDTYSLADSTGDGQPNLNMSVWKEGNYGTTPPFWESWNDPSTKNHFFVFGYDSQKQKIRPVWQSSNLEATNCDISFADLNHDGKQELVVVEGSYADWPECKGEYVAVWVWNGWGFTNEWRSDRGSYGAIEAYKNDLVITQN